MLMITALYGKEMYRDISLYGFPILVIVMDLLYGEFDFFISKLD